MINLDHLFTFPIIMVDGDNEDKKYEEHEKLGMGGDDDPDIIEDEACIPYYDFVSVSDRWQPTSVSLNKAMSGKFDACGVLFAHSGTFIVPWTKERFIKEMKKFIEKLPKEEIRVVQLSKEGAQEFIENLKNG